MVDRYFSYFDKLPIIKYDINRTTTNIKTEDVTNIFFRIRFIQEALNNIASYFVVELTDGDTPEILAEKVYGDSGAGWMIMIANKMIDPQWEWPMDYDVFNKYIISKYGSIEASQTNIHHYEMVIERTLSPDNITTERRYTINERNLVTNSLDVPYNYYFNYYYPEFFYLKVFCDSTEYTVDSTVLKADLGYQQQDAGEVGLQPGSLAQTQYISSYELEGKTITENIYGNAVTYYDYEDALNEQRRYIKIIKKEYYTQIMDQFDKITGYNQAFRRRLI